MKNKTILMASVLAVATVLAAGLTVLPSSVQEAQANPCSNNGEASADGGDSSVGSPGGAASGNAESSGDQICTFIGPTEFDE
jgi:hypothetical protein